MSDCPVDQSIFTWEESQLESHMNQSDLMAMALLRECFLETTHRSCYLSCYAKMVVLSPLTALLL